MGFFVKRHKRAEVMAISFGYDGLYSAAVRSEALGLPVLDLVSFYPKANQSSKVLVERLAHDTYAKKKTCVFQLSQSDYQLFALDALNVPQEELKSAVRWRLPELIDYPSSDATLDVLVVPGDQSAGGRNQSLIAVVARNEIIAQFQTLFIESKIPVSAIDIVETAQRNIASKLEVTGRGLAMLSFDDHGGLLTVNFGGELYLTRRLDIGFSQLQNTNGDEPNSSFERISLELQRSLDHFERQHNYITMAKLVLAPLGNVGQKLQAYLATNMYLPVEVLDLATILNLTKIPELQNSELQQKYFYVIGAALRTEEGDA